MNIFDAIRSVKENNKKVLRFRNITVSWDCGVEEVLIETEGQGEEYDYVYADTVLPLESSEFVEVT